MKFFLLILPLFLISCTNASPNIGKAFNVNGPTPEHAGYEVGDLSASLNLKGTCAAGYDRFLVSVNGSSWKEIETVLDTSKSNDTDCSDKNFDLYVELASFNLSLTSQVSKVSFKQESSKETTLTTEITVSYSLGLKAILTNTTFSKSAATANFTVGGTDISVFKYKFGKSIDCSDPSGYSSNQQVGALSINLSSLTDGTVTLCVVGGSGTAYQAYSKATSFNWELDLTPPSVITLNGTPKAFDNASYYSLSVSSTDAVKYTYKVSENDDCLNLAGYQEKDIGNSFSFTIDSLSPMANKSLFICVYSFDDVSNQSVLSKYTWVQDMTPPGILTGSLSNSVSGNNTSTPTIIFNTISNPSGSPIDLYYIKVVRVSDGATIFNWTSYPVMPSISASGISLVDDEYQVYTRSQDKAGNVSADNLLGSWIVDTQAPQVIPIITGYPYLLTESAQFNVAISDASSLSYAKAWLLNSSKSVVSGPLNISNNTDFSFTGVTLNRNQTYYLKLQISDTLGHVYSDDTFSYISPNCVSSNPNDVSVMAGVCDGVLASSTLGWKMQGGVLLASDPTLLTSFLVVPENVSSNSTLQAWGTETSGNFVSDFFAPDNTNPLSVIGLTSGAYATCRSKTTAGFSGWFLPTVNQMSKVICHSNFNNKTNTDPVPEVDPFCTSFGKSSTVSLQGSAEYWTVTEESASKAYAVDHNASFYPKNKFNFATTLCLRRFNRSY